MFVNLSPWYLKGFHVPEYEQPFSDGVTWLFLPFFDSLLENRDLYLKLVNFVP